MLQQRAVATATHLPLVAGCCVRQDGRSASLTAPNGSAQSLLLSSVLVLAGIPPALVQLVEAAANGSPLGDLVEAGAMASSLSASGEDLLLVGSVKANIGHTESASGIMGLAKLVYTVCKSQAAPNAQLSRLPQSLAASLQGASSPVFPSQLTPTIERANGVISSFGLGGTSPIRLFAEIVCISIANPHVLIADNACGWCGRWHHCQRGSASRVHRSLREPRTARGDPIPEEECALVCPSSHPRGAAGFHLWTGAIRAARIPHGACAWRGRNSAAFSSPQLS